MPAALCVWGDQLGVGMGALTRTGPLHTPDRISLDSITLMPSVAVNLAGRNVDSDQDTPRYVGEGSGGSRGLGVRVRVMGV